MNSPEKQIENFYLDFTITLNEYALDESKKIEGDRLTQVFKKKRIRAIKEFNLKTNSSKHY